MFNPFCCVNIRLTLLKKEMDKNTAIRENHPNNGSEIRRGFNLISIGGGGGEGEEGEGEALYLCLRLATYFQCR
jgi:hypothetical protein